MRASSAVYRIPYLSLGAELSRDYDDRTGTMGLRTLFGLRGHPGGRGAFVSGFLSRHRRWLRTQTALRRISAHGSGFRRVDDRFRPDRHAWAPWAIARSGTGKDSAGPSFFSGFRIAMRNPHFRSIWFSTTVFFLAVVLNFSMAIHYFTWYAHIGRSEILSLIQTCFYSGALGGVVLWMSLARRTEKRTLYIMATIASATLLLMATVLIGAAARLAQGTPCR